MTDGRNIMNMEHYIYRSQMSPSRPAFFGFGMKGREDVLKRLEDMGLTTLYELDKIYKDILAEMPKCDGKSPSYIEAMPPMVRDCRCTKLEANAGGQTICSEEKWSDYGNATCQTRKFRVSWHPGWYVRPCVCAYATRTLALVSLLMDVKWINVLTNSHSHTFLYRDLRKKGNGMVLLAI